MQNFFKFWSDIPNELAFPSFGALHIAAIASVFVLLTAALVAMRKLSARGKRGIICACSIILPLLEISRIVWLVYTGEHNIIKLLPLHLCTMQMFFIPLAVFSRSESVRDFVFFTAVVGGIIAIVFPVGVADTYPFMHFQTLQTLAVHSLLMFIPLAMFFYDGLYPRIARLPKVLLIMLAAAIPAAACDFFFGQNYMFLAFPPEGMPLCAIADAFGLWGYRIFLAVGVVLALTLLYLPFEFAKRKSFAKGFTNDK